MHAADGKDRDKHRRETMQVPAWVAMDELPSTLLTPKIKLKSQLLASMKKRSVKTPKRMPAKAHSNSSLFQDEAFLASLYSSPPDFGVKEFEVCKKIRIWENN